MPARKSQSPRIRCAADRRIRKGGKSTNASRPHDRCARWRVGAICGVSAVMPATRDGLASRGDDVGQAARKLRYRSRIPIRIHARRTRNTAIARRRLPLVGDVESYSTRILRKTHTKTAPPLQSHPGFERLITTGGTSRDCCLLHSFRRTPSADFLPLPQSSLNPTNHLKIAAANFGCQGVIIVKKNYGLVSRGVAPARSARSACESQAILASGRPYWLCPHHRTGQSGALG
jgi:hypothetical protein